MNRCGLLFVILFVMVLTSFGQKAEPGLATGTTRKIAEGQFAGLGRDDKDQPKTVIVDDWTLYQLADRTYRADIHKKNPATPGREINIKLTLDQQFRLKRSEVRMSAQGSVKLSLDCTFESSEISCSGKSPEQSGTQSARIKVVAPYVFLPDPVGAAIDIVWFQALEAAEVGRVPGKKTTVQVYSLGEGADFALESDPKDAMQMTYEGKEEIAVAEHHVSANKYTSAEGTIWTSDKGLPLRFKMADSPEASIDLTQYKQFVKWEPELQ